MYASPIDRIASFIKGALLDNEYILSHTSKTTWLLIYSKHLWLVIFVFNHISDIYFKNIKIC